MINGIIKKNLINKLKKIKIKQNKIKERTKQKIYTIKLSIFFSLDFYLLNK